VGNLRQIGDPDQSVPACERQGLVAALGLGDAENPVRSRVVDVIVPWSSITQPAGLGKYGVSKIVLRADRARHAQSGGPPIRRALRRPVADLVRRSACLAGRFRRIQTGGDVGAQRVQLALSWVLRLSRCGSVVSPTASDIAAPER
jgi:hypothetical protein